MQGHLTRTLAQHDVLLSRIPLVEDVQSAWSLLLHCVGARANYLLRVVRPDLVRRFAGGHNQGLWNCLNRILSIDFQVDAMVQDTATLPLSMGGLGLSSAMRTCQPAFWASWADCHDQGKASRCGSPDFAAGSGRFSHVAGCRVSGEKLFNPLGCQGSAPPPIMGSPR